MIPQALATEIAVIAAAVIGCITGTLGMHLYYRPRLNRKERETWRAARRFYTSIQEGR